jgi:NADPH2:quinone reductase
VTTRAIVMRAFGGPEVLALEELPLAPLAPTDLRVRMLAAAVNHSDLEVRTGAWKIRRAEPFPYVPGLEVVGEVVECGRRVDSVRVGDRVITMMQGLGGVRALRHGGYQELVTVDADACAPVPNEIDPVVAAAHGLAAVTAHQALERTGSTGTIGVIGASGGVGSVACALAAVRGARVIAVARAPSAGDYLRGLGVAEVVADAGMLAPGSIDGIVDSVAGAAFEPAITALARDGRYCMVGAMGGERVGFSAWELLRGVTITGYSSETLDGPALRVACAELFSLVEQGKLAAPAITRFPLARAADAHRLFEAGGVRGRVLLVP